MKKFGGFKPPTTSNYFMKYFENITQHLEILAEEK
jgi:hypothetical protein